MYIMYLLYFYLMFVKMRLNRHYYYYYYYYYTTCSMHGLSFIW